ncbi:MAG: glycosyltransferase [Gammaproteobacteria bacterium]
MSESIEAYPNWSVGAVVPARNEQARVQRCLDSVLAAAEASGAREVLIVLVADRCTDRTAALGRQILGNRGRVLECEAGAPGTARRLGAEVILDALHKVPRSRLWLANTDADSYVPADWIRRQLRMAGEGATAIAGIVAVDSFATHGTAAAEAFAQHYVLNADGTHPHVHGANIGVRADVYLDAGGWSDIAVGEDHCLWQRVQRCGWPVRSTTASIVTTSGRLRGRARGGFADALRARIRTGAAPPSAEGVAS